MMRAWAAGVVVLGLAIAALPPTLSGAVEDEERPIAVRVYTEDVARLSRLGVDVLESRGADYFEGLATKATIARLRRVGLRVEGRALDPVVAFEAPGPATFNSGYHTVAEQYSHLTSVAAANPALAKTVDYGDSWRKTNGLGGYDLRAICITKLVTGSCARHPGSTPRFVLMAGIHAREIAPPEVAYRWIDHLVTNYGADADITWLLDHSEMWVIPVANPDASSIVELGGFAPYTQRKNANTATPGSSNCANPPTSSSQAGVDLNRNASTSNFGGIGTSNAPCALTFKGLSPASEPEQAALETLFAQLFADTKGPNRGDAAAATTDGVFLSLHAYGGLVILPYGDGEAGNVTAVAPNDVSLRSLAFRMSAYNGYRAGRGAEVLYGTTGTTDDWVYERLGVPSFTFEVQANSDTAGCASTFVPPYSCLASDIWPDNLPALLYAAKAVRDPYVAGRGPVTSEVATTGTPATTVTARVRDNVYGTLAGQSYVPPPIPSAQNVTSARYAIDGYPGVAATAAMTATDGAFDSANELVRANVSTVGLSAGRHTLVVQGRDADGTWGPASTAFFVVGSPPVAAFTFVRGLGRRVDFDASTSTDDGIIASYDWQFGDGTTGSGPQPLHTYAAGTTSAVVTLTVTDDTGMTAVKSRTVLLGNRAPRAPVRLRPNAVTTTAREPTLIARVVDPDEDPTQCRFEITGVVASFESGWINGCTWRTPRLFAGAYDWTVQARDPAGLLSPVSEASFTVV